MFKRSACLGVAMCLVFCGVIGRTGYIAFSNAYTVSQEYNSYSLVVAKRELQLYYRDGTKLNNNVVSYRAVIRPVTSDLSELQHCYSKDEIAEITSELSKGYPIARNIKNDTTKLKTFKVYSTDTSLSQVISKQSSGVLSHIDIEPSELKVKFLVDAKGRMLSGDNGADNTLSYYSREGYLLTIDKDVQTIAEQAAYDLKSGCVIIMDPKNSQILACINKPDDTYINKAFSNYNVGSVFKIVTAASALENDVNYIYNCDGKTTVGDTTFTCQKERKHGKENLKNALADSCNCYFINLAQELGYDKLLRTANSFGFGKYIELNNLWGIPASILPSSADLSSKGELSLFSFGQGKVMSSPLQICSLLCSVSNGGLYRQPVLFKAKKEVNGSLTEIKPPESKRVMTERNAHKLMLYLRSVVSNGTARNADTKAQKSAGKTATAQTGQFKNGRELYNTWFAGIYPYDEPQYCIVIMCENGTSGAADCCPIFRTIVEMLEKR